MGKPGVSRRRKATGPSGPASCQRRTAAIPPGSIAPRWPFQRFWCAWCSGKLRKTE